MNNAQDRLNALREAMAKASVDFYFIPREDAFCGEYVPDSEDRLRWMTGFTGSAGLAVVAMGRAATFVDGRYTLQVKDEVDLSCFETLDFTLQQVAQWVVDVDATATIGYDPWLMPASRLQGLEKALENSGFEGDIRSISGNLIDQIWQDRPTPPMGQVRSYEYSSASSFEKRADVNKSYAARGVNGFVITAPDSLVWLLNIRGDDLECTPFLLAFGVLWQDGSVDVFADTKKYATPEVFGENVRLSAPEDFEGFLRACASDGKRLGIDSSAPMAVRQALGTSFVAFSDPCALPKAIKSPEELEGIRKAHFLDGIAVIKFLAWVDQNFKPSELNELQLMDKLEEFRKACPDYKAPSFATIMGSAQHGAIVHYHSTEKTNRSIGANEMLLVDSGGQYPFGTTDITRTVILGQPTDEMKRNFTLVLKGHIALATARFPEGTSGQQLDTLARQYLWQAGLDYDHGTGHGVGQYLSVHEGPQRIAKQGSAVALQPGMILSNEPGYYKSGEYGIRIENLVAVRACPQPGDARTMLGFQNLTTVPISRHLVDLDLMTMEEKRWLNEYHEDIRQQCLNPASPAQGLTSQELDWLDDMTQILS